MYQKKATPIFHYVRKPHNIDAFLVEVMGRGSRNMTAGFEDYRLIKMVVYD